MLQVIWLTNKTGHFDCMQYICVAMMLGSCCKFNNVFSKTDPLNLSSKLFLSKHSSYSQLSVELLLKKHRFYRDIII